MAELGDYLGPLEPDRMTDAGMWIWAVFITIASLAAAYAVAIAWQRWGDKRRS